MKMFDEREIGGNQIHFPDKLKNPNLAAILKHCCYLIFHNVTKKLQYQRKTLF